MEAETQSVVRTVDGGKYSSEEVFLSDEGIAFEMDDVDVFVSYNSLSELRGDFFNIDQYLETEEDLHPATIRTLNGNVYDVDYTMFVAEGIWFPVDGQDVFVPHLNVSTVMGDMFDLVSEEQRLGTFHDEEEFTQEELDELDARAEELLEEFMDETIDVEGEVREGEPEVVAEDVREYFDWNEEENALNDSLGDIEGTYTLDELEELVSNVSSPDLLTIAAIEDSRKGAADIYQDRIDEITTESQEA